MGDPKRIRKKYKTPRQPFEVQRIEHDLQIIGKYGLRNMKEVWKHSTMLRHFRGNTRRLLSLDVEDRKVGEREILGRLQRMGLVAQNATLDDVLGLKIEDFLDRRLQTVLFKNGMATTPHHSRQMITHGHILIGDHVVNSPSYFVNPVEEKLIKYASSSPFAKSSHKALPENVYKSKKAEEDKRRPPQRGKGPQRGGRPPQRGGKPPAKPAATAKPKAAKPEEEEEEKPLLEVQVDEKAKKIDEKEKVIAKKIGDV